MRTTAPCAAIGALVALLAAPAFAKTLTVKGQVVDEGCGLKDMKSEQGDHAGGHAMPSTAMDECMLDCAKKGEPLALVTADGKVYRIVGGLAANKNEKLIPHMKHTVEITGEVGEAEGKVTISANALKMVSK
jgi:hypothetical protein